MPVPSNCIYFLWNVASLGLFSQQQTGSSWSTVCRFDNVPEDTHILWFKGGGVELLGLSLFSRTSPPGTVEILSRIDLNAVLLCKKNKYMYNTGGYFVFGYCVRANWTTLGQFSEVGRLNFIASEAFWDKGTAGNCCIAYALVVSSDVFSQVRKGEKTLEVNTSQFNTI